MCMEMRVMARRLTNRDELLGVLEGFKGLSVPDALRKIKRMEYVQRDKLLIAFWLGRNVQYALDHEGKDPAKDDVKVCDDEGQEG